ncbi:hypothetical protein H8B06_01870 [Sphingobacterium sp. DN00404]|uniref:Uncharacterized protein n=1 Tax=Sphingobacterium micropteri TaxID=2763501 RepID=A0ABR7YJQ4_9SPHI|nr:hypothetical protein [Sphingobacterium micropteri]MBD1431558.1 hypothetical protein [Sphingobacterium micropteri]
METIGILFFALASFVGIEESRILSRKATVAIDPVHQTFEVVQEDLFSIVMTEEDRIATIKELQLIMDVEKNPEKNDSSSVVIESVSLQRQGDQLHATLKGRYTDVNALREAGIYVDNTGFSMINIPEWNIRSTDAALKENYWEWPANKKVTLMLEAFENIPTDYLPYRHSVLPYWDDAQTNANK